MPGPFGRKDLCRGTVVQVNEVTGGVRAPEEGTTGRSRRRAIQFAGSRGEDAGCEDTGSRGDDMSTIGG